MVHLDTSIVVAYFRGNQQVKQRIAEALPDLAISTIVLQELLFGACVSARSTENLRTVDEFLQIADTVPFDRASAATCAEIKAQLRRDGKATGEADALIAATAVAHGAKLITHNTRHFMHIGGLEIEDWLEAV